MERKKQNLKDQLTDVNKINYESNFNSLDSEMEKIKKQYEDGEEVIKNNISKTLEDLKIKTKDSEVDSNMTMEKVLANVDIKLKAPNRKSIKPKIDALNAIACARLLKLPIKDEKKVTAAVGIYLIFSLDKLIADSIQNIRDMFNKKDSINEMKKEEVLYIKSFAFLKAKDFDDPFLSKEEVASSLSRTEKNLNNFTVYIKNYENTQDIANLMFSENLKQIKLKKETIERTSQEKLKLITLFKIREKVLELEKINSSFKERKSVELDAREDLKKLNEVKERSAGEEEAKSEIEELLKQIEAVGYSDEIDMIMDEIEKAYIEASKALPSYEDFLAKTISGKLDHLDYFATLGISSKSSEDEIKKAYKNMALIHHPDKGGDAKKFINIHTAKEKLLPIFNKKS